MFSSPSCLPVRPESGPYPALAESDVPPSLPHRAEAAAAHAAQNLLVAVSLHLSDTRKGRERRSVCARETWRIVWIRRTKKKIFQKKKKKKRRRSGSLGLR